MVLPYYKLELYDEASGKSVTNTRHTNTTTKHNLNTVSRRERATTIKTLNTHKHPLEIALALVECTPSLRSASRA